MTLESSRVVRLVMQMQGVFLEVPGLHLTLADAARRFAIDRHTCEAVLGTLVNSGVLARADDGSYVRFFPRMAHAA